MELNQSLKHTKAARPVVMGRHGMVSSGHYLASLTGARVLAEGGNAVDAALATSLVLAVVRPHSCGPGGDLFALISMKDSGKVEALNASGPAPRKATIDFYKGKGLTQVPTEGPLSIAMPGFVDGWLELHRRYGTMDPERLACDAVRYARNGFPLYGALLVAINESTSSASGLSRVFREPLPDLNPGRLLVQPGLAETLEQVAKNGRDSFYHGELAARICEGIRAEGGVCEEEDLKTTRAEWLTPISTTYRGYTLYEQPPVSQGFIVLEMLNIIEGFPLDEMNSVDIIHAMVESKKLAFEDRLKYFEDPRFGDPKLSLLLSKEHALERRAVISDRAQPREDIPASLGSDTTYLCTADQHGNAVSLIQSIFASFGSRVVAGNTGIIMNNRLSSFGLDPTKANALEPGKRPVHTLNSYMVFHEGKFFAVGGTPGADDQPQTNVQILHQLLDRRMDPQTAIELPRWSHRPGTPPRLDVPEELRVEKGIPPKVRQGLKAKGHKVKVLGQWQFGGAELIVRDPTTGTLMAGADPRREGYAIGL